MQEVPLNEQELYKEMIVILCLIAMYLIITYHQKDERQMRIFLFLYLWAHMYVDVSQNIS